MERVSVGGVKMSLDLYHDILHTQCIPQGSLSHSVMVMSARLPKNTKFYWLQELYLLAHDMRSWAQLGMNQRDSWI